MAKKAKPPLNLIEEALQHKWEPSVLNHVRVSQWTRRAAHARGADDQDVPARPPTEEERGAQRLGEDDDRTDTQVIKDELSYHEKLRKRNVSRASLLVVGADHSQIMIERLLPHHIIQEDVFPGVHITREATLLSSTIPPSARFAAANSLLSIYGYARPHRISWHDRQLASPTEYALPGDLTDHVPGFRVIIAPAVLRTPASGIVHVALNARVSATRFPFIKLRRALPGGRPARCLASFIIAPAAHTRTILSFILLGGPAGDRPMLLHN